MHHTLLRTFAALLAVVGLIAGTAITSTTTAAAAGYSVSIAIADTTVVVGDTITITGQVSPRPSSRYVYLQRRAVGSTAWSTVKRATASSSGAFTIRTTAGSATDRYYRVYKPKQGSRKAGRSVAIQVVVDPVATTQERPVLTALEPASGPLSGGTTVTFTGTGLAATTGVTFTPLVGRADTVDGTGILPELPGTFAVVEGGLEVVPPASLGGPHLVKVYTPSATLTASFTYATTPRAASAFEAEVLAEINERRAAPQTCHRGGADNAMPAVAALSLDEELADLAFSHSRDLAARQDVYSGLSHVTWRTTSFSVRFRLAGVTTGAWGEVLALSPQAASPAQVVDQWMASTSGHCESLMSATWTRAGVGVAAGAWNTQQSIFSNVDFR